MKTFERRTDRLSSAGLVAAGLGIATLIVQSWIEYMSTPGITPIDGYWIGREPWSSAAIVLVLAGTGVGALAGALVVLIRGDWLRRVIAAPLLALPVLWWLVALGSIPYPGFAGPDPVALAFRQPVQTALLLLLPTIALTVLGTAPIRHDSRVRLCRVHPEPRDRVDRRAARRSTPDVSQ